MPWTNYQGVPVAGSVTATSLSASIRTVTSATTVQASDCTLLGNATTAAFSITLTPAASSTGRILYIKKIDSSANAVTIQCNASETLDGNNTLAISAQNTAYQIQSNGTSWYII